MSVVQAGRPCHQASTDANEAFMTVIVFNKRDVVFNLLEIVTATACHGIEAVLPQPAQEQIAGHQQEEQNDDVMNSHWRSSRCGEQQFDRPDAMEVAARRAGCTARLSSGGCSSRRSAGSVARSRQVGDDTQTLTQPRRPSGSLLAQSCAGPDNAFHRDQRNDSTVIMAWRR